MRERIMHFIFLAVILYGLVAYARPEAVWWHIYVAIWVVSRETRILLVQARAKRLMGFVEESFSRMGVSPDSTHELFKTEAILGHGREKSSPSSS